MHGEAEDTALRRRDVPRRAVGAVELRARDVDYLFSLPRSWRQLLGGAAGQPMVVAAEVGAVHRQAMNEAGLTVGDEKRFRVRIKGEPAERRARIGPAVGRDVGEQADASGRAVDPPDRPRTSSRTPQPPHESRARRADPDMARPPVRAGRDDRKTIGRSRRHIDVRRFVLVERDAEHLPDRASAECERLRRADKLSGGRTARVLQVDDPERGAVQVDEGQAAGVVAGGDLRRRRSSGEPGHRGVPPPHDRNRSLLRAEVGGNDTAEGGAEGRREPAGDLTPIQAGRPKRIAAPASHRRPIASSRLDRTCQASDWALCPPGNTSRTTSPGSDRSTFRQASSPGSCSCRRRRICRRH